MCGSLSVVGDKRGEGEGRRGERYDRTSIDVGQLLCVVLFNA